MADPLTAIGGAVFSAITTTFKLAEFCLRLKDVDADSLVFVRLIARVHRDLAEALRVRRESEPLLSACAPDTKAWIDGAILDTRAALNDIGAMIESVRVDTEEKGRAVTLVHRFEWVLNHHERFVLRERALATCHRALLGAIAAMQHVYMLHALSYTTSSLGAGNKCAATTIQKNLRVPTLPPHPPAPTAALQTQWNAGPADGHDVSPILVRPSRRRPKRRNASFESLCVVSQPAEADPYWSPFSAETDHSRPGCLRLHKAYSQASLRTTRTFDSGDSTVAPSLPEIEIQVGSWGLEDAVLESGLDESKDVSVSLPGGMDNVEAGRVEEATAMPDVGDALGRLSIRERRRRARSRFEGE